ncbi:MAG: peptidylprolyl isomerase [Fimbriiglobus sp.]
MILGVVFLAVAATGAGSRAAGAENPVVAVETSMGTFEIELFADKSPITVKNFLGYVEDKFYDGTVFHRVIGKEHSGKDFMVQGGGFEPGMKQKKVKDPIKNESANGVSNTRGTLAMARTSVPDSATAQFFVNVANNTFLDQANAGGGAGYAVFGRVTKGMDVVDKIKAVETTKKDGHGDVPKDDILIKSVKLVK